MICRAALFVSLFAVSAGAQSTWNDPRTLAVVRTAIQHRAEQLADTGLVDYQATAHGYLTFLVQLGSGFPTPPKIVRTDQLALQVYWRSPNLSKQRIIGRRDTTLLPTDILYHRDHLGIVQNNFPNVIRLGEGDEVRDVPHPLSPGGMALYDYAIADSLRIAIPGQTFDVYEVKVRPKDATRPAVVGAIYLDRHTGQVVRMAFSFTRAALLDPSLEDISIVLENGLIDARYWLPRHQDIEIRRTGTWFSYPVRGIIRGRWEISDYRFNLNLAPTVFIGPEIVQAPPALLKQYPWTGKVLDSLPPDVRAVTDPDIQRVQAEARQLVRARALERAEKARVSARNVSDFARVDRVEGLALGGGMAKQFGSGFTANVRARYAIDEQTVQGAASLSMARANGITLHVFGSRDFRDVGDVAERSAAINSLAAQEFGSDYTDPYLVQTGGASVDFPAVKGFNPRFTASYEWQSPLGVNARPVTGTFLQTVPVDNYHATRYALELNRAPALWTLGTELTVRAEFRATFPYVAWPPLDPGPSLATVRGAVTVNLERPFGDYRLATATTAAAVGTHDLNGSPVPPAELVYFGGPVSAPGYDYHSLVTRSGLSEHVELRIPAPFIPFSLGRFGRVPSRGSIAPFAHVVGAESYTPMICIPPASGVFVTAPGRRFQCDQTTAGWYPSLGAAYLTPFDLIRFEVARGVARGGRWTFSVDVSREFWSIM
ncbi:MAG: hypothetical protein ACREPM_01520 [Gemmatimonadaceae bacterium]